MKLPLVTYGGLALLRLDAAICMDNACGYGDIPTSYPVSVLNQAAKDAGVTGLLLDLACPGGSASGTSDLEAAVRMFKATGKALYAIAHDAAYSSGYWLACLADELVVTPSGGVGSIGTMQILYDDSKRFASEGVEPVVLTSGEYKPFGPGVPISEAQREHLAAQILTHNQLFINCVAEGRRMSTADVLGLQARTYLGNTAVQAKLADRVVGYQEYLNELIQRHSGKAEGVIVTQSVTTVANGMKGQSEMSNEAKTEDKKTDELSPAMLKAIAEATATAIKAAMGEKPAKDDAAEEPKAEYTEDGEGEDDEPVAKADASNATNAAKIEDIKAVANGDADFIIDAVANKWSLSECVQQKAKRTPKTAARNGTTAVPVMGNGSNTGEFRNYEEAVRGIMNQSKIGRGSAVLRVVQEYPELYNKWLDEQRDPKNQVRVNAPKAERVAKTN